MTIAPEASAEIIDPNELPANQPADVADDPNPPAADVATPAPPAAEAPDEEPEQPRKPKVGTVGDDKRRAIYERFKRNRGDGPDPEPEPEPPEQAAEPPRVQTTEAPAAGPSDSQDNKTWPRSRHKLKVRGQEIDLDTDQVLKLAQIGLAGESYLSEARAERDAARRERRQTAEPRGAAGRQHPDDTDPASSSDRYDEQGDDAPQHPEDPFEQLVDKIQFGGDRQEIAQSLRNVIASSTRQELIHDRMAAESARSQGLFNTFFQDEQNADIADGYSRNTMLGMAFEEFKDDLVKLGQLSPDADVDPSRLALAHRYLRVEHKDRVRTTEEIINSVATKFRNWKTGQAPTPQPRPQAQRPPAPGVAVQRDDRKLRVPAQPQRHTALPPLAAKPIDIESSRAKAADSIRASRRR